ncbi:hypothetical protein C0J52_07061 [Blattella germanica]|nr:hypothetical protein C0J52_07061 [Blattella germanica]
MEQLVFVIIVMPRVKYPLEQRVFLFEIDTKQRSYLKCRIRFIRKFRGVSVPNKSTIHRLVCKVRKTGAFADKTRNRKRTVLTEEKLDDIGACFEQSPHKSLSKLAQQVGVSVSSVWNATKLLKLKPYKIGRVHKLFENRLRTKTTVFN